ncbi:MAG: TSUP family transporter, partial [Chloroflexota bacterium]
PLVAASLVGNVIGTQILLYANQSTLRVVIGITVVLLSLPLLLNYRLKVKRERLATLGVGLVSGVLIGSTTMGGPPVVLFGVNQLWAKQSLRANMLAYSTITFFFTSVVLFFSGAVTQEILMHDVWMLPGVALGLFVGNAAFQRAPHDLMYRAVVLFVIASGVLGVYTSLAAVLAGKV